MTGLCYTNPSLSPSKDQGVCVCNPGEMRLQPAVPNPLDRRSPQGNRSPVDGAELQRKRLRRPGWAGGDMANHATIRYVKAAGQFLCGCLGLAALTFVGFRLGFTAATVGFCYLILIESVAVFGSFIVCVVLSVITVGCLNYFFVPPLLTFRVNDVQDAVALAAFLLTSIAITALTTKIRTDAQTREAAQRAMIDTIPAMIWSAFPDGSRDFNNRQLLQYTGLSENEAAGGGWATTLHPEDRPRVLDAWYRAVETGEPFEVEGRGRSTNGEYRLFQMEAAPQRDARGRILKWYGRSIDIEERKRDLEALRQSEERWKAVFEHNPTMYFMVDRRGTVLLVNDFGASQLGYFSEELIGRPVLDVFYPPDRASCTATSIAALEPPAGRKVGRRAKSARMARFYGCVRTPRL
jgi:PAS domain S-box-containing protein